MSTNASPSKNVKSKAANAGGILRGWLAERIEIHPSYSLRAMARNLGVSPGFLSQVMNGRKRLSPERAIQFSQVMKLTTEETNQLLLAASVEATRTGSQARAMLEELTEGKAQASEYKLVEVERFKVLSRWYHIAILDLVETEGFSTSSTWIAKRLKISPVQASEAVERLKDLGLLVVADGHWKKAEAHLGFSAMTSNAAIREYHKQMISKAAEALSDATPEAFDKRSITGTTIAINPDQLPEAFAMIDRFRKKLEAHLSVGKTSEVYQMNVQLFNLSHTIKVRSEA